MKLVYFDCFSGISGDMTLGALVSLGLPVEWLQRQIYSLPLKGFDITARQVKHSGIQAVQIDIAALEDHHHRGLKEIKNLIFAGPFSDKVKNSALGIFDRLAGAEAKIHGCSKEEVHFHEVGAVDALVDVLGTCLGLEYLGIERIVASPLPLGRGFVHCQHGTLPVPAPATLEILKGVPVYAGAECMELVTPTGAAIITGLAESFQTLPCLEISAVGYGAGTHALENQPNLLRIILGRAGLESGSDSREGLIVIETAIDDLNPEIFGFLMDKLFADGALDVYWTPVQMKKNRPGTLISVLCTPANRQILMQRLFKETTTLGIRFYEVGRMMLPRQNIMVNTAFGSISVKEVINPDGTRRIIPEFEVCKEIAERNQLPLQQVYDTIRQSADKLAYSSNSTLPRP